MEEKTGMKDGMNSKVGKKIDEKVAPNGFFVVEHIRNGEVIDVRVVKNVVTNAGKAEAAGLICSDVAGMTAFDYIAIGTGTTAATATDTEVEGEITTGGGARAAATGTRVTTTVSNDTAQFVVTYNFTAGFAVTESGVLNAASTGDMLCRQTFSAVNVANGDSLQITWKVQMA